MACCEVATLRIHYPHGPRKEMGSKKRTRGRPKKTQSESEGQNTDSNSGIQHCASCAKEVDDDAIGCDSCERWVCNTVMCSGLPQQLLDAINQYDGSGINFICIKCRIQRQNSPTKASQPQMMELISQLFQQVQGICNTLQGLTEKVGLLASQPKQQAGPASEPSATSHPPSQPAVKPQEQYREIVRDEVREIQEREKRRQSIIVKGLKANSPGEIAAKFSSMTEEIMGASVSLSDITPIPNHPHMFRAKIYKEEHRRLVLEKAKLLKESQHSSTYISRDLTFAQRTELFNRRKSRRAELNLTLGKSAEGGKTEVKPAPEKQTNNISPAGQGNRPGNQTE